jgi:hypothetical protein
MNDHKTLLAAASKHEEELGACVKAWACELNGGHRVLVSYWYAKKNYSAKALVVDTAGSLEIEMIAAHLNERLGAGKETVKGMRAGFNARLKKSGRSLDSALVHVQAGKDIH